MPQARLAIDTRTAGRRIAATVSRARVLAALVVTGFGAIACADNEQGGGNSVGGTSDDNLPGGIEVRDPDIGIGEVACNLDLIVVEAEHCSHRAGLSVPGVVHGRRTFCDEANAIVEAKST